MKASVSPRFNQQLVLEKSILSEQEFLRQVTLECRRAERSKHRFIVALIRVEKSPESAPSILHTLGMITRNTDMCGWYEESVTIGVLFSELGGASPEVARDSITLKLQSVLKQCGPADLTVAVHILPLDITQSSKIQDGSREVYSRLEVISSSRTQFQLGIKRGIDIIGSVALLILLSPLMALIAISVKCGSRGPVLFRQTRVGQRGVPFTFLKFRSMEAANDHSLHENYVKDFIRGTAAKNKNAKGEEVFKLTQDPRVTPLGRFLRKSSFDELPQLWNVLRGDMSLVGPRPPIPYEVECYDLWHQRRVLDLKPGITGLWQVSGRNRTGFNEMVRLDLRYARTWSPWLDLKILLLTPYAVINGGGAH